ANAKPGVCHPCAGSRTSRVRRPWPPGSPSLPTRIPGCHRQGSCPVQAVSWARTPTALFPQSPSVAWVEANLRTLATPFFTSLVTANYFADPIDYLELVRQDELAVGSAAPSILSILPFPASWACI